MIHIRIILDGEGAIPEMRGKTIHRADSLTVTGLAGGMQSGKPSVALVIPLEDGSFVFAETSLALFLSAADALRGRYGDPRR